MSITAIVENGIIKPLEPLPGDWGEGKAVLISEPSDSHDQKIEDEWLADYENTGASLTEQDFAQAEATVAEHRREAKDQMAKEMGLK